MSMTEANGLIGTNKEPEGECLRRTSDPALLTNGAISDTGNRRCTGFRRCVSWIQTDKRTECAL